MRVEDVYREYDKLADKTCELWKAETDREIAMEAAYHSGALNMARAIIKFIEEEQKEKPEEKAQENVSKPKKAKAKPKESNPGKADLDMGKVKALRKAGWTMAKIADEMGVTPGTICNRLKAEEVKNEANQNS